MRREGSALPVAAKVKSAVHGPIEYEQRFGQASVPRGWSINGSFARMAERMHSSHVSNMSIATRNPASAEVVADVDLPSEEIGFHFAPEPLTVPSAKYDLICLFLSAGFWVALGLAFTKYPTLPAFVVAALFYVLYIAETVGFGTNSAVFFKDEQCPVAQAVVALKNFRATRCFIRIYYKEHSEIVEYERVLDNSCSLGITPGEAGNYNIFEQFGCTNPVMVLNMEFAVNFFSERERGFLEERKKSLLERLNVEPLPKNLKEVAFDLLIADDRHRALYKMQHIVLKNPAFDDKPVQYLFNFWVYAASTCCGVAWIHRQIINHFFIDYRNFKVSKVFIMDHFQEFEINLRNGGINGSSRHSNHSWNVQDDAMTRPGSSMHFNRLASIPFGQSEVAMELPLEEDPVPISSHSV